MKIKGDLTISVAEYRALQEIASCLAYLADKGNKAAIMSINNAENIYEEVMDIVYYDDIYDEL